MKKFVREKARVNNMVEVGGVEWRVDGWMDELGIDVSMMGGRQCIGRKEGRRQMEGDRWKDSRVKKNKNEKSRTISQRCMQGYPDPRKMKDSPASRRTVCNECECLVSRPSSLLFCLLSCLFYGDHCIDQMSE